MKKLLSLLLIVSIFVNARAQGPIPVQRSSASVIPIDANAWFKALKIPVYQDSAHAFAVIGIDSIGYIWKELRTANVWIRDSNLVSGGHKWTLLGNGPGLGQVFNKWGTIITGGDSIAIDTNALVAPLARLGFLRTEADPVALIKTITINQTAQRGIIIDGSNSQALGNTPNFAIRPDTAILAPMSALAGYLPKNFTADQTINANGHYLNISNAVGFVNKVGGNYASIWTPNEWVFTDTADNKYGDVALSSSGMLFDVFNTVAGGGGGVHGMQLKPDTLTLFPFDLPINFYGLSGGAKFTGSVLGITAATTDSSAQFGTTAWGQQTFLKKGSLYHVGIFTPGATGDSLFITAHDSTFVVPKINDSAGFHHYYKPDGSVVFYATSTGGTTAGPDTISIVLVQTTAGDSLKVRSTSVPSYLGAKAFVANATESAPGLEAAADKKRLDSTLHLEWGAFHKLEMINWTRDTMWLKGLDITDTSGKLHITLRGDTSKGLQFNIDAGGLAGTGTVDSAVLTMNSNTLFTVAKTGTNAVNPQWTFTQNQACGYCVLWNNNSGSAIPAYSTLTLAGNVFKGQGATNQVLLGGGSTATPLWGSVNLSTMASGTLQAAQMPAVAGVLTNTAGSLTFGFANASVTAAAMGVASVDLSTSVVTNVLPAAKGGSGVNNGSNTLTLGGPLAFTGANTVTFNTSGTTNATLPAGSYTILAANGSGGALSGVAWSVQGTPNQVSVNSDYASAHSGATQIGLPQDIAPGSSVAFTHLALTGLGAGADADSGVSIDGSGNLRSRAAVRTSSGHFVPTITMWQSTNLTITTVDSAFFIRSGNIVTVDGSFTYTLTSTATAAWSCVVSLPIASYMTSASNSLVGMGGMQYSNLPDWQMGNVIGFNYMNTTVGAIVGFKGLSGLTNGSTYYVNYHYSYVIQ